MSGPYRRLLLKVIRRQEVILRSGEIQQIAQVFPRRLADILPVLGVQGLLPAGRQGQGRSRRRGQQPQKAGGLADDHRRESHQQQPQHHREPHLLDVLRQVMLALLALGRGLPLQQPLPAHQHPPQGRHNGRQADPGLIGQQPQPDKGLHDGPADAGEQPGVPPQPLLFPPGKAALRQTQHQIGQQRQQRRPGRHGQGALREQEAGEDGDKGHGREKTPPEGVKQPEGVHGSQLSFAYPGPVLPVAPNPAVLPLVVGQGPGGEAVAEFHIPHVAAVEIGPFQGVMAENPPLRQPVPGALQQGVDVKDALPGKAAVVKGVHVQLPAQPAIGVAAPGPGEDQGEVRGVGAPQLRAHPGVNQTVAPDYPLLFRVDHRGVQRVCRRADQLSHGPGVDPGVTVQGDEILDPRQGPPVPGDLQLCLLAPQQFCQGQQRAPLPLMAAVALPVEVPGPGEQIKTPAVFPVQLPHRPPGGPQQLRVVFRLWGFGRRKIGQKAEQQVLPLAAAAEPQLLQPRRFVAAQNGGDDAKALVLGGDSLCHVQPGQGPGLHRVQQDQVRKAL